MNAPQTQSELLHFHHFLRACYSTSKHFLHYHFPRLRHRSFRVSWSLAGTPQTTQSYTENPLRNYHAEDWKDPEEASTSDYRLAACT